MSLLEVQDLNVQYRVYEGMLKVLNGISFSLEKGEKVGIIGESACGKTTTVKSIMRILASNGRVSGGKIRYNGEDVLGMSKRKITELRRRNMSMIFQDPSAALNPVFTVRRQLYDIIKYSAEQHMTKQEIQERAVGFLKQAALPEPDRILDSDLSS